MEYYRWSEWVLIVSFGIFSDFSWTDRGEVSFKWRLLKIIAHWVRDFRVRFSVFLILSYPNACHGCENAENPNWSEFFYDRRKFRRQCVNLIDTTWGRIYFLKCENVGLRVQWPNLKLASPRSWMVNTEGKGKLSCSSCNTPQDQLHTC